MRLRLTRPASRQLDRVLTYIAERNPQGARHVQARLAEVRLAEVMYLLLEYPLAGTRTARPGQRRILASPYPYAVTYRVEDDEIVVLGIRHTARRPA